MLKDFPLVSTLAPTTFSATTESPQRGDLAVGTEAVGQPAAPVGADFGTVPSQGQTVGTADGGLAQTVVSGVNAP